MTMPNYTIRVYGICINNQQEVLITHERIGDFEFTKFPGGGMEAGEGTLACLQREWLEELHSEIEILDHFYTTDFYQASAFHTDTQLLSVYYLVKVSEEIVVATAKKKAFSYQDEKEEYFRWMPIHLLTEEYMSFPVDKYVVRLLKKMTRRSES